MRIAVISEVSARDKNPLIIDALKACGHEVFNVGMTAGDFDLELTYIHTGLMAATLLNLGVCDLVVGGCGTGQGFLISAMQYPKVFCGLLTEPLDAFLFGQINGGNCVSLALNKGFGWAGDINLKYIFEKLFAADFGKGYPENREESQQRSRRTLNRVSEKTHREFKDILVSLDGDIVKTIMRHKPFVALVKGKCADKELQKYIVKEYIND